MALKTNVHRRSRRKTDGANFPPIAIRALSAGETASTVINVQFDRPVACNSAVVPSTVTCGARVGTAMTIVDDNPNEVAFTFNGSIAGVGSMTIPNALPGIAAKNGPGQLQGVVGLVVTD